MKIKLKNITIGFVLVIIGISAYYLFFNQATGTFSSDLTTHIQFALNGTLQYSITGFIYKYIYLYLGKEYGIALFLTIVTILNIILTKKALSFYMELDESYVWIYAILLNFAIGIVLPFISNSWNVGIQSPNKWHNSTYICMRPIGLLIILLYNKIKENYLKKIQPTPYIIFCLLLILVNSIKPNFIIAFAPTMLVFLIIDFIKNFKNKKAVLNIILFGTAVLISLPILLYQNFVLFNSEIDSGISIGIATFLIHHNNHPILAIFQSTAFPLFILLTNFKTIIKNKEHLFIWIFNLIALLEFLFLQETGSRIYDGNFTWGFSFALMLAFISSIAILKKDKNHKKIYYIISYTLLSLHIIMGVIYYIKLLLGGTYY